MSEPPESFHEVERTFDANGVACYHYTEDASIHVHVVEADGRRRISGFCGRWSTSHVSLDDSELVPAMEVVWSYLGNVSRSLLVTADKRLKTEQRKYQVAAERYKALHPDERLDFWKRLDEGGVSGVE